MKLYTIGFTKKTARQFFNLIKNNVIEIVLDIRLNNKSQLSGFAKGEDLAFFLQEICQCRYQHYLHASPTKELLDTYKKGKISWNEYEKNFLTIMAERQTIATLDKDFKNYHSLCLLCTEDTPEQCHRRLVAELWKNFNNSITITHLVK